MNLPVQILVYGGVIPGAIALVLVPLCRRFLPESISTCYAAAVAFAVAFFAGYVLLPSWAEFRPTRHWQWIAYLGPMAMIVGPVSLAAGVSTAERWLLHLLLALVAAGLLVPDWPNLEPSRPICIALLTGYLFLIVALLDSLPPRLLGPLFLGVLSLAALCVAVLVAMAVSITFGQLGGIATAATAGCLVSSIWHRNATAVRGLVPAFSLVVGGLAFAGCIEPQERLYALLLVPAAPLTLWFCAAGPLARLQGLKAAAVQIAVVLVPLIIAVVAVIGGDGAGTTEGY